MSTRKNESPYILAVDDENDLLLLIKKRLVSLGFEVATSLNADSLWNILQDRHPDPIFLDIQMNGIDGCDICTRIKNEPATAAIPVHLRWLICGKRSDIGTTYNSS